MSPVFKLAVRASTVDRLAARLCLVGCCITSSTEIEYFTDNLTIPSAPYLSPYLYCMLYVRLSRMNECNIPFCSSKWTDVSLAACFACCALPSCSPSNRTADYSHHVASFHSVPFRSVTLDSTVDNSTHNNNSSYSYSSMQSFFLWTICWSKERKRERKKETRMTSKRGRVRAEPCALYPGLCCVIYGSGF